MCISVNFPTRIRVQHGFPHSFVRIQSWRARQGAHARQKLYIVVAGRSFTCLTARSSQTSITWRSHCTRLHCRTWWPRRTRWTSGSLSARISCTTQLTNSTCSASRSSWSSWTFRTWTQRSLKDYQMFLRQSRSGIPKRSLSHKLWNYFTVNFM